MDYKVVLVREDHREAVSAYAELLERFDQQGLDAETEAPIVGIDFDPVEPAES